jgi:hypothetical protein
LLLRCAQRYFSVKVRALTNKGSRFFYEQSGEQFFMRGIQYQDYRDDFNTSSAYIDPLEDGARCARDIRYFKELGINTVYVLHLRAQADHVVCMTLLRDNGIYVIVSLGGKIEDESRTIKWDHPVATRFMTIVADLARFPNIIGFRILGGSAKFLPFTKAATRDLKEYMRDSGFRNIPIGYKSFSGNNAPLQQFLTCGGSNDSIDFLLYSDTLHCTNASQLKDAMERLVLNRSSLPMLFVTTACDTRTMADSKIMLSAYSDIYMTAHSGVVLYSYFDNAPNNSRTSEGARKFSI